MRETQPTTSQEVRDEPQASRAPSCPVCSGPFVELRGQYRCTRCFYTLCVGCEPSGVTEYCGIAAD